VSYAAVSRSRNLPAQYAADVAASAGAGIDTTVNALSDDQLLLVQQ
jgi:hypothetical protein